jgi:hypothetical protein
MIIMEEMIGKSILKKIRLLRRQRIWKSKQRLRKRSS